MVLTPISTSPLIPRPYQVEGIEWLTTKKRAMLTDRPGLGKTIQAGMAAKPPALVIAPSYLIEQWADFIRMQFPTATVAVARGTRTQRQAAIDKRADWTIVNIEMIGSHKTTKYVDEKRTTAWGREVVERKYIFNEYKFPGAGGAADYRTIIFDESHHFRGHKAARAKRAVEIAYAAEYVFMLTATPIVKEADDLFQQLRILYPNDFKSYNAFLQQYCYYEWGTGYTRVLSYNKQRVGAMLAKYALGRTYKNVGMYLPPLIEKTLRIDMSDHNMKRYKEVKHMYRFDGEALTSAIETLNMLRYITVTEEKVVALHEILDYDKRPAIVFTWFRETAALLQNVFGGTLITGDMPPEQRKAVAQSSDRIYATIASLCEGVDLSHAKTLVFFECDYTPGKMYQAMSRAHRGRKDGADDEPVLCYYLMHKKTVDEDVYDAVVARRSDAREILKRALRDD
jgi:superfamily II DNA or RNA helicase